MEPPTTQPPGPSSGAGRSAAQTTPAVWRFGLGDQVRWAGNQQVGVIALRRWVERQIMPPYAEYYVQEWGWIVEADLDRVDATG